MSQIIKLEKQIKKYAVTLEGLPESAANFGVIAVEFNIDPVRCITIHRNFAKYEWAKTSFDRLQCVGDVARLIMGQTLPCIIKYGRAEKFASKNDKATEKAEP